MDNYIDYKIPNQNLTFKLPAEGVVFRSDPNQGNGTDVITRRGGSFVVINKSNYDGDFSSLPVLTITGEMEQVMPMLGGPRIIQGTKADFAALTPKKETITQNIAPNNPNGVSISSDVTGNITQSPSTQEALMNAGANQAQATALASAAQTGQPYSASQLQQAQVAPPAPQPIAPTPTIESFNQSMVNSPAPTASATPQVLTPQQQTDYFSSQGSSATPQSPSQYLASLQGNQATTPQVASSPIPAPAPFAQTDPNRVINETTGQTAAQAEALTKASEVPDPVLAQFNQLMVNPEQQVSGDYNRNPDTSISYQGTQVTPQASQVNNQPETLRQIDALERANQTGAYSPQKLTPTPAPTAPNAMVSQPLTTTPYTPPTNTAPAAPAPYTPTAAPSISNLGQPQAPQTNAPTPMAGSSINLSSNGSAGGMGTLASSGPSQSDTIFNRLTTNMAPSANQTALEAQQVALDSQLRNLNQGQGVMNANIEDQPIQLGFITGQKSAVEKRYGLQRSDVQNQQQTLQAKLALEQKKMQSAIDVDKTQLAYSQAKEAAAKEDTRYQEGVARDQQATKFSQDLSAANFNENTRQFGIQYAQNQQELALKQAGQAFDQWATQQNLGLNAAAQSFDQWAKQQGLSQDASKQAYDQWLQTQNLGLDTQKANESQRQFDLSLGQKESQYQRELSLEQQKLQTGGSTGGTTGGYAQGQNATVDAWANRIQNGSAKITDIPASQAGLRNQVTTALDSMGNSAEGKPTTTELGKAALVTAKSLLDKFNSGSGTSAVGGSRAIGGGLAAMVPGTSGYNFSNDFNSLKSQLALEGVKYLKGQGAVSDAERALLSHAVTKLNLSQSEAEFKSTLDDIIKRLSGGSTGSQTGSTGTTSSGIGYTIN